MKRLLILALCLQSLVGCRKSSHRDNFFTPQPIVGPNLQNAAAPEIVAFILTSLNNYRAQYDRAPLVLDQKLSEFSQEATQEFVNTRIAHGRFARLTGQLQQYGFCTAAAENQGWGYASEDPEPTIRSILQGMMGEGPGGGHYENILHTDHQRVGIGFLRSGDQIYLTNDFSNNCRSI